APAPRRSALLVRASETGRERGSPDARPDRSPRSRPSAHAPGVPASGSPPAADRRGVLPPAPARWSCRSRGHRSGAGSWPGSVTPGGRTYRSSWFTALGDPPLARRPCHHDHGGRDPEAETDKPEARRWIIQITVFLDLLFSPIGVGMIQAVGEPAEPDTEKSQPSGVEN